MRLCVLAALPLILASAVVNAETSIGQKQIKKDTVFFTTLDTKSDFSLLLGRKLKKLAKNSLKNQCIKIHSKEKCSRLKFEIIELDKNASRECGAGFPLKEYCYYGNISMKAHIKGQKKIKNVLVSREIEVETGVCTSSTTNYDNISNSTTFTIPVIRNITKKYKAIENPEIVKVDAVDYMTITDNVGLFTDSGDRYDTDVLMLGKHSLTISQRYVISNTEGVEGSQWQTESEAGYLAGYDPAVYKTFYEDRELGEIIITEENPCSLLQRRADIKAHEILDRYNYFEEADDKKNIRNPQLYHSKAY